MLWRVRQSAHTSLKNDSLYQTLCSSRGTQTLRHYVISPTTFSSSSSSQVFAEVPSGKRGLLGTKGLPCDKGMGAVQSTHTSKGRNGTVEMSHHKSTSKAKNISCLLIICPVHFLFFKPSDYSGHAHTHIQRYTHTAIYTPTIKKDANEWKAWQVQLIILSLLIATMNILWDYKDCHSSILEGHLYRSLTLSSMNFTYILLQCIQFFQFTWILDRVFQNVLLAAYMFHVNKWFHDHMTLETPG